MYLFKLHTAIVSLASWLYVTMALNIIIKLSNFFSLATENTLANKNKTKIADSDVGNVLVFEKNKKNPINNYPSFENDMPNVEIKGHTSPIAWDTDLSVIPDIKK